MPQNQILIVTWLKSMLDIRYAQIEDLNWINTVDDLVSYEWKKRSLKNNEYIIATLENEYVGLIRYSFFWGKIPYMDLIRINRANQNQGNGTALFKFWEKEMQTNDFSMLMTSSTKGEEEPLKWHKRNGFKISGELKFDHFNETEIFLVKDL